MKAIKEKLHDISAMRHAKAQAKEEERVNVRSDQRKFIKQCKRDCEEGMEACGIDIKAEKEYAKARVEAAHEKRLAREKQAEMDLHIAKAADDKVVQHQEAKLSQPSDAGHPPSATICSADGNPISR